MATTRFRYRTPDQTTPEGPCDLQDLAALLHNKTICLETQVQDADRGGSEWRRIADWPKLQKALAKLVPGSGRLRAPSCELSDSRSSSVRPHTSHAPVSSAHRTAPASDRVRHKPQRAAIAFASVALLLAITNSAWLLLTTALAQPPEAAPGAGLNAAVATPASEPPAEEEAIEREGATLQAVLDRLNTIDQHIAHLEFLIRPDPLGPNLTKAIQAGEMSIQLAGTELRFIYVPAGTFSFGFSPDDQTRVVRSTGNPNAYMNASPQVRVHMARGYFMLDREVTTRQWNAIMGVAQTATDHPMNGTKDPDLPKRNVSWLEATAFCEVLEKNTSLLPSDACLVRLPTELEWEYAARGSGTLSGMTLEAAVLQDVVVTKEIAQTPLAVSALEAPWLTWRDHFNMLGNLSEWCHDSYDQNLHESLTKNDAAEAIVEYDPTTYSDPTTDGESGVPPRKPSRVLRGGSFKNTLAECEPSLRRFLPQDQSTEHTGFRPVLVVR